MVNQTHCSCGHPAADHQPRCTGQCTDPIYGIYRCLCHAYNEETP